ncbi:MAG: dehydratase, partial [Verrucomicrobia bacterium]
VHIGDTITSTVTVAEKRDHKKPEFGIVVEKLEVTNQKQETVLVCEHILLVHRKTPASP